MQDDTKYTSCKQYVTRVSGLLCGPKTVINMMPIVTHYYWHIWNCYAAKTFIASLTQIERQEIIV